MPRQRPPPAQPRSAPSVRSDIRQVQETLRNLKMDMEDIVEQVGSEIKTPTGGDVDRSLLEYLENMHKEVSSIKVRVEIANCRSTRDTGRGT